MSDEQVQIEMMNATIEGETSVDPAAAQTGTETETKPEDDPMKMMQESMNKENEKK